ncbi:MAG: DUF3034 family protein [Steroidobacteraceae bacterium]
MRKSLFLFGIGLTAALVQTPSFAASSRLPATGGVMQIEGSAGGGLVPWAVIAGLGSRNEVGGSAFCTRVEPQDYRLESCGAALGLFDRVELSYARQDFGIGDKQPFAATIQQHMFGVKVKVVGDAVYDQDSWLPQIAVGMQHKVNEDYNVVPKAVGARDDSGNDYYVAATKVWLSGIAGRTTLLNATLRATKANQLGILGFGGDANDSYQIEPELSVGVFVHDKLVLGTEYRTKPDNLKAIKEDDFKDVYLAWVPVKFASITVAYADLGIIAGKEDQHGLYASFQASF